MTTATFTPPQLNTSAAPTTPGSCEILCTEEQIVTKEQQVRAVKIRASRGRLRRLSGIAGTEKYLKDKQADTVDGN